MALFSLICPHHRCYEALCMTGGGFPALMGLWNHFVGVLLHFVFWLNQLLFNSKYFCLSYFLTWHNSLFNNVYAKFWNLVGLWNHLACVLLQLLHFRQTKCFFVLTKVTMGEGGNSHTILWVLELRITWKRIKVSKSIQLAPHWCQPSTNIDGLDR